MLARVRSFIIHWYLIHTVVSPQDLLFKWVTNLRVTSPRNKYLDGQTLGKPRSNLENFDFRDPADL